MNILSECVAVTWGYEPANTHVLLMWVALLKCHVALWRQGWEISVLFYTTLPLQSCGTSSFTAQLFWLLPSLSLLFHRSAFTMHVEAGHSAVPEEGPKDLRCPLCLYHTKYKRNMIDHIVLHRGNDSPVCACLMREMLNNAPVFLIGFIKFSPLYICTSMLNRPSALQYPLFLSECTSY